MKRYNVFLILSVLVLLTSVSHANTTNKIHGTISRVLDGDTVVFLPSIGPGQLRIRLHGIDAPETCQPWGQNSTLMLKGIVEKRQVYVQILRTDRFGRNVAVLWVDGVDINSKMVATGNAWSYRNKTYKALEIQARANRLGLHSYSGAVRPSVFRQTHGRC